MKQKKKNNRKIGVNKKVAAVCVKYIFYFLLFYIQLNMTVN